MPAKRKKRPSRSGGFLSLFSKFTSRRSSGESFLSTSRSLNPTQMLMVVGLVVVTGVTVVFASQAATANYSLWTTTEKPAEIATWDKTPAELGLRFSAKKAGSVTGVRFYKAKQNTGTHLGHLWDAQGRKLAEVTFKNETASGWQTASFAKAIAIKPGQEYVVSYYTPTGNYGITTDYFKTTVRTNKDLIAPASTKTKKNGVSRYGAGFPDGSYRSSNYWVDIVFQPVSIVAPTPKPTTTPVVTPVATPKPVATPVTSVNLTDTRKKDIAMQLVSSAENSSLNWRAQYGYIEDIGDGRGYTAGIIGFCTGCGDLLELVKYYNTTTPGNVLAKYIPALQKIGSFNATHAGLDPNFTKDWKTAAATAAFQQAQDRERDRAYFNPAVNQGVSDGLHALGQFIYYDAMVVHGPGSDASSFGGIRAAALKKAKTPAQGGNETTYLNAFLDVRNAAMKAEAAHEDTTRVDTAQRVFLNAGNLNLNTPLNWKVYGDSFSIK